MKQTSSEQIQKAMNHSICRRAQFMHTILTGYSLFDSIQVKKRCTNINLSYTDAEIIANKYEEITGTNMSPSEILFDRNALTDQLLDEYRELQKLMDTAFDKTLHPVINAYYHHLSFYRKPAPNIIQTALIALTAFLNYTFGCIDKKELKKNIIDIDIIKRKAFLVDSKYVRHNLIKLEHDFNEICIKRTNREMKKSGKVYNEFSINMSM